MEAKGKRIAVILGAAVMFAGPVFAQQTPNPGMAPGTAGMTPAQAQQQQTTQQIQNLEPNQDTGSTGLSGPEMRDRAFLRKAYSDGLAEIQLGRLALNKSSNADVKAFAQMMVDDHTAINAKLSPLAESAGVTLVQRIDKADQTELAKLKDMSGEAFDKEYAVYMFTSHRISQHDHRVELSVASEANGLKQQVAVDLDTIHKHWLAAQKLVGDVGAQMPPRPNYRQ